MHGNHTVAMYKLHNFNLVGMAVNTKHNGCEQQTLARLY